ncbi:fumarylacetoacetate hydrolase family protein [Terrabacter terrigena]|uniref:Fumarylacetoacetate hydrolase family protein n=1 Tax=Terrabacter terrigena TaxID=574718 RepID=A0ABW3MSG0_9MICO
MHITRYVDPHGGAAVGVDSNGRITPLDDVSSLGKLLRLPLSDIRARCEGTGGGPAIGRADVRLLPPVDSLMEVWAAGVTYRRSREARVQESDRAADVYELVYDAERPELFFKSVAWRVTGHGEQISVRGDSEINVPEPELALVLNAHGETVGYTICNDVSSRSIEGMNPLYLPQAKVYLGGCAVGPAIRPAWELADPYALTIRMSIERSGDVVWDGQASTAELRRNLDDLASFLVREESFPEGAVLSTGTSLVPDLPFTLVPGDTVRIEIDELGVLKSRVAGGRDDMRWVVAAADNPARACPLAEDRHIGSVR